MSEKGIYKKANGPSWDYDPNNKRSKENKFFEQAASDEVVSGKKSQKKGTPRADHKHEYAPICVWRESRFFKRVFGTTAKKCTVCGKVDFSSERRLFRCEEQTYVGEVEHFWNENEHKLTPFIPTEYQKKVLLAGAKNVNELTSDVKNKLVEMMNCQFPFLISDSEGGDFQLQKLLQKNGYPHVTVYYRGVRPRFNLGGWKTKSAPYNLEEQMLQDCDEGFIVVKGKDEQLQARMKSFLAQKKEFEVCVYNERVIEPRFASCFGVRSEKDLEYLRTRLQWDM